MANQRNILVPQESDISHEKMNQSCWKDFLEMNTFRNKIRFAKTSTHEQPFKIPE